MLPSRECFAASPLACGSVTPSLMRLARPFLLAGGAHAIAGNLARFGQDSVVNDRAGARVSRFPDSPDTTARHNGAPVCFRRLRKLMILARYASGREKGNPRPRSNSRATYITYSLESMFSSDRSNRPGLRFTRRTYSGPTRKRKCLGGALPGPQTLIAQNAHSGVFGGVSLDSYCFPTRSVETPSCFCPAKRSSPDAS